MPLQWKGVLAVTGGVLVHLSLGTIYSFGNLTPYLTSYIRVHSSPSTLVYSESTWIFTAAFMGLGSSMFLGGIIELKLGPKLATLLGAWLMSLGVLLTYISVKVSFALCVVTYGLMLGLGLGMSYAIPLSCGMKWMPKRKGLVSGIVGAGFGGGAFIFDQIQTHFINPLNKAPDLEENENEYFTDEEVLQNVPHCFLLLGGCYAVLQLIGSLMISVPVNPPAIELPPDEPKPDQPSINAPVVMQPMVKNFTPREMLKTRAFYTLYFIFILNSIGSIFISSLYKAYGETFIDDDAFIAWIGAFSAVFNALGRIMWGHLADRFSFRLASLVMCTCFTFLMLTLGVTSIVGKALFFVWVCLIFLTFSGIFSMLPAAVLKTFGPAYYSMNFGLVYTSQIVIAPVTSLLTSELLNIIGWYGMFFLVSGASLLSCLLAYSFNVKNMDGSDI